MKRFLFALLVFLPLTAKSQCADKHYRWSVKTTTQLFKQTPTPTTIPEILTTWPVPEIYGITDKCKIRQGNETKTFILTGWVHRRKQETGPTGDGDWHLELTAQKTDTVPNNCIVVEIPDPKYGVMFKAARDSFMIKTKHVKIDNHGDLSTPIQITVAGPAFFDGEHRGARSTNNPPRAHGRCNSVSQALWEIHPVYLIK